MKRYTSLSNNDTLAEIWEILIDLAVQFRKVCDENNLRYFLIDDALLGAVAYNDFKPWDDNLDFVMPREDYDKFLEIGSKEFHGKYFLQTPYNSEDVYNSGASRLRNSETTCVSSIDIQSMANQGLWIDIIPLDYISDNTSIRDKQIKKVNFYQLLGHAKAYPRNGNIYGIDSWKWSVYCWFAYNLNSEFIHSKAKKWKVYSGKSTKVTEFVKEKRYSIPHTYEASWFEESIDISFHKEVFKAPKNYREVLSARFGKNYLIPPPMTQRQPSTFNYFIDTKKSYKEYAKKLLRDYPYIEIDMFTRRRAAEKQIVIYGSKRFIEKYLKNCESQYFPIFAVSDDKRDLGYKFDLYDISILPTETINEVDPEKREIVVCSSDYLGVLLKLKEMGINRCYVYCDKNADLIRPTNNKFLLCLDGYPVVYKKDGDAKAR